jgi:DNA-binding transcriptional MerR regulator
LQPDRTEGGTRRYSANDLTRLRRIADLLDAGLNLAGISMVLDLEVENTQLRADQLRADQLRADQLRAEKEEQPWPTTASTPARKSPKQTSSNSRPRSIRN